MMDELHADAIISKDVILNLLFFEAAVQCFGAPPPRAIKMRLPCSLYKTLNVTAAVALVLTRRKRPGEVQVLLLQTDPVVPLAPPPPSRCTGHPRPREVRSPPPTRHWLIDPTGALHITATPLLRNPIPFVVYEEQLIRCVKHAGIPALGREGPAGSETQIVLPSRQQKTTTRKGQNQTNDDIFAVSISQGDFLHFIHNQLFEQHALKRK